MANIKALIAEALQEWEAHKLIVKKAQQQQFKSYQQVQALQALLPGRRSWEQSELRHGLMVVRCKQLDDLNGNGYGHFCIEGKRMHEFLSEVSAAKVEFADVFTGLIYYGNPEEVGSLIAKYGAYHKSQTKERTIIGIDANREDIFGQCLQGGLCDGNDR